MKYLKLFESFFGNYTFGNYSSGFKYLPQLEDEINDILLEIEEDFQELKWSMKKTDYANWTFNTTEDLGEYEARNYFHKMTNHIVAIKGRLLDIGIKSDCLLKRARKGGLEISIILSLF